jgi:hypothetical protein
MEQKRPQAAKEETAQVERQKPRRAEYGLHGSTEEVEGEHIHEEMPEIGVQEPGCEHLQPASVAYNEPRHDGVVADDLGRGESGQAGEGGGQDDQQMDVRWSVFQDSPPPLPRSGILKSVEFSG